MYYSTLLQQRPPLRHLRHPDGYFCFPAGVDGLELQRPHGEDAGKLLLDDFEQAERETITLPLWNWACERPEYLRI